MAIVQDTYSDNITPGYPGMVANGETFNVPSRTVADAAGIAFGKAVFQAPEPHSVTATPGTDFVGIVEADHGHPLIPGGTADVLPQYASAACRDEGTIWVTVGSVTTVRAPVFVTPGGDFTATAAGNTAIPGKFLDAVGAGAVARVRLVR